MWLAGIQDDVALATTLGIRADRDPRDGHDRVDVRLGHAVDHDRDVESVVHQRVEREIGRVGAEILPELRERPPGPVLVAAGMRDPDPAPPGVGGHVLPARAPRLHLGPDPDPDLLVAERRDALVDAQTEQRRWQDDREGRCRRRVRVLVGRDIDAFGTRPLQHLDGLVRRDPRRHAIRT